MQNDLMNRFDTENNPRKQIRGNIYLCKINTIEPALQAAFVSYGGQKQGFLPLSEISPHYFINVPKQEKNKMIRNNEKFHSYKIQNVLKKNQTLLIQIIKEERGGKGASVTTNIGLVGCYCVLIPLSTNLAASKSIVNPEDKERLLATINNIVSKRRQKYGVILKSAACKTKAKKIEQDYIHLSKIWENKILEYQNISSPPSLIYPEENIINRTIRDSCGETVDSIIIEGADSYKAAREWMKDKPQLSVTVKPYKRKTPLFTHYKIEEQILSLYKEKVQLPSGGHIVINCTEALISIDVNSGKMMKEADVEDTAYKTNLEAAYEIPAQLELRNLSGLIIIDFIDMEKTKHCKGVEEEIEKASKKCKSQLQISSITKFGVMQASRQRAQPSILESNTSKCHTCDGNGYLFSESFIFNNIIRDLYAINAKEKATIYTSEKVALYVLNEMRSNLIEIEKTLEKEIVIKIDNNLNEKNFRIDRIPILNKVQNTNKPKLFNENQWVKQWLKNIINIEQKQNIQQDS